MNKKQNEAEKATKIGMKYIELFYEELTKNKVNIPAGITAMMSGLYTLGCSTLKKQNNISKDEADDLFFRTFLESIGGEIKEMPQGGNMVFDYTNIKQ